MMGAQLERPPGDRPTGGPFEIVCLATRRLINPLPTNVQHLMRRLAGRHGVLYVEPAVDPIYLARHPRGGLPGHGRPTQGIPEVLAPWVFPWGHRSARLEAVNRRLVVAQVRQRMRRLRLAYPIVWFFSPLQAWLLGRLGEAGVCYHITDDYLEMPWVTSEALRRQVAEGDARILRAADAVFITSAHLACKRGLSGPRMHVVPNVADVDLFGTARDPATPVPGDIAGIPRPIAGFIGAVDAYKVDLELLRACAQATPEISYVLIGPVGWSDPQTRVDGLRGSNVHLLGPRPFQSLPGYAKAFDVTLIPYRKTAYTESCSPLKLYEYLAAGKPVISTDLPGVREAGELVAVAGEPADFAAAIRRHLGDGPEWAERRAAFAARHSWSRRVAEIEAIVAASLRERERL